MRRGLIAVVAGVIIAANLALLPWNEALFHAGDRDKTAVGVLLEALGEVRTFMAQSIWFNIDIYHHEMEAEGINWKDERDLMSMYRMVTTLDPRFAEAYDVASFQLVQNFHRVDEGLAYLDEGLQNNPTNAQLWFNKAFLMYALKRYPECAEAAARAMGLYAPDPVALLEMSHTDRIDFMNALRLLTHAEDKMGNHAATVNALRIWLLLIPNDAYARERLEALNEEPRGYTKQQFLEMMRPR